MRIIEYAKEHPILSGFIAIVGLIIFILIVRGGSNETVARDPNRPSDAEIAANASIESARIQAAAQTAQANAAVGAAQIGAGVQLNSDNKAAEIAMAQINAAKDIAGSTIAAEQKAYDSKLNIVTSSLPSLKKKNRDDVLQALVTGEAYYPSQKPNKTAETIGAIGGAAGNVAKALGSIFSDSRLKENIRHLGYDDKGRSIYEFNYKGSNTTRRGYMAQEIARSEPEKVWTDPVSGFMKIPAFM